jgi:hypothetical protein
MLTLLCVTGTETLVKPAAYARCYNASMEILVVYSVSASDFKLHSITEHCINNQTLLELLKSSSGLNNFQQHAFAGALYRKKTFGKPIDFVSQISSQINVLKYLTSDMQQRGEMRILFRVTDSKLVSTVEW